MKNLVVSPNLHGFLRKYAFNNAAATNPGQDFWAMGCGQRLFSSSTTAWANSCRSTQVMSGTTVVPYSREAVVASAAVFRRCQNCMGIGGTGMDGGHVSNNINRYMYYFVSSNSYSTKTSQQPSKSSKSSSSSNALAESSGQSGAVTLSLGEKGLVGIIN
jgi:hypothetical protein